MDMTHKGFHRAERVLLTDTAMLLALAAAKQASSATSMAQARLRLPPAPRPAPVAPRIALFAAAGRPGVSGSFDPGAASLIGEERRP